MDSARARFGLGRGRLRLGRGRCGGWRRFGRGGSRCRRLVPYPVEIGDGVEIGACTCIDRAKIGATVIGDGTKIDNLVQIAHNVTVGEHSILVAQVGISGSTRLGKHVVLAGQVGIAGHVEIGDRVRIAAKSGVAHSVEADQDIVGLPAVPHREWFRMYGNIQRLGRFKEELRRLKEKVQQLERKWNKE